MPPFNYLRSICCGNVISPRDLSQPNHHFGLTTAVSEFRCLDCTLYPLPIAVEADGKVFTDIYLSLFISFITHLLPPSASLPTPIDCITPTACLPSPLTASRRTSLITSRVILRILAMPILIIPCDPGVDPFVKLGALTYLRNNMINLRSMLDLGGSPGRQRGEVSLWKWCPGQSDE